MVFGFGSKSNTDNRLSQDAARLSPERQMTKLREKDRTGGRGDITPPLRPPVESSVMPPQEVFEEPEQKKEGRGITLELTPDANDKDMEELLGILQTKGFYAALKELDRLNNPHLEDDFHRLLVQYKKEGHKIPGLNPKDPLAEALDFVLLEVEVPALRPGKAGEPLPTLKDIVVQMEQFYLSVLPHIKFKDALFFGDWHCRQLIHREHFVLELAVSQGQEHAIFYLGVPRKKRDMFEKQLFSIFPRARVNEKKDDYNPFNQFGATAAAYGYYYRPPLLPLKTVEEFTYDPMNVTLASLSKITKEGEGLALQIAVAPAGNYHSKRMHSVLNDLNKAKKESSEILRDHMYLKWRRLPWRVSEKVMAGLSDIVSPPPEDKSKQPPKEKKSDTFVVEAVTKKLKSPIVGVNVRITASARTKERADALLENLELSFGQYEDAKGGLLQFKHVKEKRAKREFLRRFIFRTFDRDDRGARGSFLVQLWREISHPKAPTPQWHGRPLLPMNLSELATMFHFAIAGGTASREAKTSGSKRLPAPPGLPEKGIVIGKNVYSNIETPIHFTPDDRLRHMYVIGQTGTGKTNFLKHMIAQDIENGEGVCFIDPHGVDVLEILSRVPKERYDDLIYFDPAYTERPMGLNMLEYDPRYPEQKTFVVDEMFKIFKKLYGDVPEAFGPIFEQYFRNATLLVLEDPDTGSTLMDISRVLADEDYRHLKLSRCRNAVVRHFWEDIAENVRGEGDIRNVVPYITSKFDIFIANEIMRPIVGQQRSAFDFKDIMDNKKILLVNLSKGRLGDVNANLLGLVIVGKIMMTSLGRTEYLHQNPPPFYLYIDEFQNVTTNTIAVILSEARKFRLSITMAHQFIGQLIPEIKNAVFGNVGTMAVFRVGPDDSEYMTKQFEPAFTSTDFLHLDNYHAYLKLLAAGKPVTPFSLETIPFYPGDFLNIDALRQISYQRYGRARETVEEEIRRKYEAMLE